ncbi:C2 calcium-dependent domain-containing protein 4C-like [Microcaecilia unicolor]|uniref:C2 calcium-dependent domain-containing protein 4C-like n=1 Tax=Microcaecilia unicolor TaxID=1415580 RepID=A0A6P7X6P1_9AMPH|nr:C2 calcium-dependent domain-containing protein 4C-like [Microcaecilia unicolor]
MWLLDKLRETAESGSGVLSYLETDRIMLGKQRASSERSKKGAVFPNVLTPDQILIRIPPKLTAQLEIGAIPRYRSSPNIHIAVSEPTGAAHSAHQGMPFAELHVIRIESAEDAPADLTYSDEESTNADPQSQAALSLPHLPKAQTSYGFCTLLESPHTRRKESLFHSEPVNLLGKPCVHPRSRSNTCCKGVAPPHSVSPVFARLSPTNMFPYRQGTLDSDTASSTESSPFSSPLLHRSLPRSSSLFKALSQDRLFCRAFKVNKKPVITRNNSISTEEGSSTDSSPNITRRASEGLIEPVSSEGCHFSPSPMFPLDLMYSRERFIRENTVHLDRGGVLRLSAEYCPQNKRLRIRLISAEGLYHTFVESKSINCCISLSLGPGKVQKQKSTVIRKSRNPIFNEDFFFDGICEEDLFNRSIKLKAVNKGNSMKRDFMLGKCELRLISILPA